MSKIGSLLLGSFERVEICKSHILFWPSLNVLIQQVFQASPVYVKLISLARDTYLQVDLHQEEKTWFVCMC